MPATTASMDARRTGLPARAAQWLGSVTGIDFIGQQAVWWWAILFAASDAPGWAALGPGAYVALRLATGGDDRRTLAKDALVAAAIGALCDAALIQAGAIQFFQAPDDLPPVWMMLLWSCLALGMPRSFRWLAAGSRLRRAGTGAVAGALAYRAGAALGALSVPGGAVGLAGVALGWAIALPVLTETTRGAR